MQSFHEMESTVVMTEGGAVQGCLRINLDGKQFLCFLGIPYAKPPVGELRFKAPLPVEPWIGIRDATKDGTSCYQRNMSTGNIEGSEDCLNLNVFTKEWREYEDGLIGPVIEKPNDTEFISKPTMELMMSGEYNRVPIMIGYCSNEGLLLEIGWRRSEKEGISVPERKLSVESFIPPEMNLEKESPVRKHICEKLCNFYFKGKNADNIYLLPTDFFFVVHIIRCTKLHARKSKHKVYLYRMSLDGGLNLLKRTAKLDDLPGACHADDLGYLFKNTVDGGLTMGEREEISVRRFVKLWTNFAKYGEPTPEGDDLSVKWNPVDLETIQFLDIGDELTTHIDPENERMHVWKEIYQLSPTTSEYL